MTKPNYMPLRLLLYLALATLATLALTQMHPGAVFSVSAPIYHDHALKHGVEAEIVRNCQQHGPVLQIWLKYDSERYHCLYRMPDGRIGDQITQLDVKGLWHEITSFARYENNLSSVEESLAKEAQQIFIAK